MSRTNIDIDDEACARVMAKYQLGSKKEAVNYALNLAAGKSLSIDSILQLEGIGWDGDLESMRQDRTFDFN